MIELIESMRREGNSVGGVIECVVQGVPPGLGEPVFDKLEADLAKAMLSLPATKGFEIGSGFAISISFLRFEKFILRILLSGSAASFLMKW